jgi:hypothetical protein
MKNETYMNRAIIAGAVAAIVLTACPDANQEGNGVYIDPDNGSRIRSLVRLNLSRELPDSVKIERAELTLDYLFSSGSITAIVESWITDPDEGLGIILVAADEATVDGQVAYTGPNASDTTDRPILTVCYSH